MLTDVKLPRSNSYSNIVVVVVVLGKQKRYSNYYNNNIMYKIAIQT